MRRKAFFGRRPQRALPKRTHALANQFRPSFETLETRVMLTAQDLMIGLYDGGGTLRYNETADVPAPGAVAPGDNGLDTVSGEAVAPDGTFYVSSLDTGQVYHYSNSGVFLGTLGENDSIQSPLEEPGTLAFGPDGNLYVADLATSAIYQFNVNSATQQYQADDTITLAPDDVTPGGEVPIPGGFTFATDGDLIVGDLSDGSVANYHDGSRTGYYIQPYTAVGTNDTDDTNDPFLNPAAILAENNGDLLIADIDFDYSDYHHQVVEYTPSATPTSPFQGTTSQFINFTTPLGTNGPNGDFAGDYAQPESLLLDQDGNLLVGVSPDDNGNGAVQQYNINTGTYISTIVSGIATPAALAYIPAENSDLLVADYDNSSVLRYDDSTDDAVAGGVPSGSDDGALNTAAGVAVAADGTYYVSSIGTGQVLHYSSSGTLLGALGQNDAIQSPLEEPGTLAFGPDGDLYVADLATSAIYQFNVNSPTQQYQPGGTITLTPDGVTPGGEVPTPGGFTFAANGDLIVGDLSDGSVANYHDGTRTGYYIQPYTAVGTSDTDDTNDPFLNPAAILAENNGDLLIADIDFDYSDDHHQVVQYTPGTGASAPFGGTTSQFINFTTPLGTNGPNGDFAGDYAQPESLLFDQDGNLLVGVSPDDNDNGAVQEYNINTSAYISTIVSGIGTPAGLAMIHQNITPASIVATNQALVDVTAGQTIPLDQNLTISSADASVTGATVSIGAGFVSGADTLNFTNQNGISGSYNASTGVLTLSGSATPAQYQAALQSITFSSTSSSVATRAVSYVVNDADDPGITSTNTASLYIVVSAPITITGAWVDNPSWGSTGTENFFGYLASHGLGSATLGYALQTGANQLNVLPWANVNTISVQFSGPVSGIGLGSLKLVGGTGSGSVAAPSVTGFASDGNNTYSWTLASSLGNNKYVFAIATTGSSFGTAGSTQVVDANGAGISGTFTTSSSAFPSGNGLAGSTFDFFFDLLPGDGNQGSLDNASDTSLARSKNNDHETSASYNPYVDYNGAGLINATDAAIDLAHNNIHNNTLTAPTAPAASQQVGGTGFTALALGVQETGGSTSLTAGGSPASTSGSSTVSSSTSLTAGNVVSAGTTSAAATSASTASSGSAGAGSSTTAISTPGNRDDDGHHFAASERFAAADEALSDFELADLYV